MDIEKLRKRYQGPMMNQDIMDCIAEIELRREKYQRITAQMVKVFIEMETKKNTEIERLRKALEFYATGKHLNLSDNEYETGAVAFKALKEK